MKPTAIVSALTLLGVLVAGSDAALAQAPPGLSRPRLRPWERPTTSPYLNLLGTGPGSFEFQYFRRVRPELEFRRANTQLQRSVEDLQRQIDVQRQQLQVGSGLGPTGHQTSFLNLGGYFNSSGGGSGAVTGGSGGGLNRSGIQSRVGAGSSSFGASRRGSVGRSSFGRGSISGGSINRGTNYGQGIGGR